MSQYTGGVYMGRDVRGSHLWTLLVTGLAVLGILLLIGCGTSDSPEATPASATAVEETEPTATATPTVEETEPTATATPTVEETELTATVPPTVEETELTATVPTAVKETEPTIAPTPTVAVLRETGQVEGITFVVGDGSEATFTVNEKLARLTLPNDAVVRTSALSGEVHLDGRPSVIEIDLHQLASDQSRRDGYIRSRMFPDHPVATFTLDDARPLPPRFTEGEEVTVQVTGQLDIAGIQAPVVFDVEARDDGDVIYMLGRTSFVWDDFQILPPNIAGFVQVKDEVSVEVLLAVRPAA